MNTALTDSFAEELGNPRSTPTAHEAHADGAGESSPDHSLVF
jgi:hypothetical protein